MTILKELNILEYSHVPDSYVEELIQSRFKDIEPCIFNIYTAYGEEFLTKKLFAELFSSYER